jgi:hypothetical protein
MSDELKLTLQFNEERGVFILNYMSGEQIAFQVCMVPDQFEKLAADMVRTIKNYNLAMAIRYTEKVKNAEATLDDSNQKIIGFETAPEQPSNTIDENSSGSQEVIPQE